MTIYRLLILIVGISFILGLMIWLVDAIYRLYFQISFTAPLLANLLLLLLIVLLGVLIAAFIYYFNLFSGRKSSTSRNSARLVQLPAQKTEAAGENLKAIRQQVAQIQDEISRQALLERSQEIERNLTRGNIRVVVFGTGSAGKTSVVNGLIGRMVGEVGAPMGTTQAGETYRLQLQGLSREILITDTPGILEVGEAGSQREQLARQLATEADLLLFVVDNDLRQSEYTPLRVLAEIGKRSLIVLNKADLYTEQEQEVILQQLRDRVQSFIPPSDVVAVSANPQAVALDSGDWVTPEVEIMPLIRRLAAVLRAEGEDLIADNILLQSQRLGEEARRLIDKQRRRQADKIIDRFQWIGAGVIAVTPVPVVDLLATAAVNAQMVVEIGKIYGCELNMERGRELALSLGKTLVSLGVVKGAVQMLSTLLQLNVATYLVGKTIQGITAAYLTRIAGKSFIEYFRHNQDWGDGGMTEVVQTQFKLLQKEQFMKGFVKDAIVKFVQPMQDTIKIRAELEETPPEIVPMPLEKTWQNPLLVDDWDIPPSSPSDDW
ncbi:GTP-binding protein [Spirulina subsalsa FACHB-351]|uniref:GTP-binding protein n=1 Tax=Spirulina subsalsa FACHB-351 TaxID=234711 RepID=A0ABT3L2Q5_9CYAN|nr:GTP-binding protein [Spirulina subsalsa]MCW6035275.1 GTP-binding protein [Spirulina subsalsa FACHB-351]